MEHPTSRDVCAYRSLAMGRRDVFYQSNQRAWKKQTEARLACLKACLFFSSHLGWSKMNPGQLSPCSGPCGCSGTLGWPAAAPAARPPSWEGCVGASLGCWLGETSPVPPPRFGDLSDPPGGRARDVPCPPARTRSTSPCHRGVPFLAANLGRGGGLPWNRMNLAWRLLAQAPEPFKAIWVSRGLCSQGWSELMGCPAGAGSWRDAGEVGMAPLHHSISIAPPGSVGPAWCNCISSSLWDAGT